ncbi:MAG: hypothetical protein ABJF10_26180, partial [Chthoniobacter sp.]|uniref:hypothetical protein n=1 Tax=Chthoniobacter sp. TaxID=2510640 RepID=UPI0032A720D1
RGLHRDPAGGKTEAPSMHKDLLKGWHFFSLQAGEHEVLSGFEKRLVGERRCTVIHFDSEEFLCRLSKKIVSLRLHLPIIGLFPMDQLAFLASVQIWNPKTAEERFEWQWDVRDVNRVLLRRLAENCAYAAFGFLVRLSSRCRSKLGFSDKFPIDTLTLRPGVAVSPGNLEGIQGAIITYTPIPQTPVSEDFVRYKGSTSKLESMLRDQLKQHSSATRFEYCVRPSKEQRRAMTLPDKVVENVGLKVIRRSGEATDGSAAVISVPLCFAMHPPNVSLDQLLRYGEEMLKAKRIADVIVESGEEFLVFCFEPILYAIIKAFRRNAYGDRIAFLGLVQKQLQRKWEGVQSTGEFLSGGKRRFEPQFYFTEEELAAKDLSEVTKRRLSHCRIPSRAMSDNGVIQDKATHRYPGYSGTPTLYKTLVGLDADFLLRGVSEHHWASLVPAADEWKNLYGKAYADWLSTSYKNPELLRNLLSAECRTSWKENEDELRDLAFTTVDLLKERASRILRNAVENAQRLVMSGRQPSAIVVRKKSELIHLWKAYLRKFLTARTFERFNLKCQVDEAAESLCDDVFEDDDARKELDQFDE